MCEVHTLHYLSPPVPAYFIQLLEYCCFRCVDVFLGSGLLVLAKEMVAAVIPSGDVVFVEAAWDLLLRRAYKHVAIRCVCDVRVDLGDQVFFF